MPKKSQKKKAEKLQDFAKKKLKVGKTAQKADSFTDTSFSSRSILLPDQQISLDKSLEITNSKHQTLNDILIQIRNYSAHTRKADMLTLHPALFKSASLNVIIHALSKCFVDDERIVRKALAVFCADFFATMTTEQMKPFITITMAYVSSAMNHIYEDIRLDGLHFLDVFVKHFPELIEEYAEKIIPNFISLITTNYGQERRGASDIKSIIVNPNSKIGSEKSRLHALQSFHQFIFQLLRRQESEYWYLEDYNVSIDSLVPISTNIAQSTEPFKLLSCPQQTSFVATIFSFATTKELTLAAESRIKIGLVHSTKAQTAKQEIKNQYHLDHLDELENLICILLPAMVDFWIEAFPIAFPVGVVTVSSSLMILDTLIKVLNLIWRSYFILLKTSESKQTTLIQRFFKLMDKHITTHFPFGNGAQLTKDGKLDALLQQMNIQYAEILCHFLNLKDINTALPKQKMLAYVDSLLAPLHKHPRHPNEIPVLVSLLKFDNLKSALPMIWKSIENGLPQDRDTLITSLFTYFDNQPTSDPSKHVLFRFIARILLLQQHPQYISSNFISSPKLIHQTKHFLEHLPKLLWNLKQTNDSFTREILSMLASVMKSGMFGVHSDPNFLTRFRQKYQSVFRVTTEKTGNVYGPFVGMTGEARLMALDLCYYTPGLDSTFISTVVTVLSGTFIDADVVVYFLDMIERCNAEMYFGALFTLCALGSTRAEAEEIRKVRGEDVLTFEAYYEEKRKIELASMLNSSKRKRSDGEDAFAEKMKTLKEYMKRKIDGLMDLSIREGVRAKFDQMTQDLSREFRCIPLVR